MVCQQDINSDQRVDVRKDTAHGNGSALHIEGKLIREFVSPTLKFTISPTVGNGPSV